MASLLWGVVRTATLRIGACSQNAVRTCSSTSSKLMAFFDDKANWGKKEVKVGRAWNTDELRIKSNADLHKLWYVLLKELNMLKTMEYAAERQIKLFPNPERIDKVELSMKNLEAVVRERNTAYHMLETGETGERPAKFANNQLGMRYWYKFSEHLIPKYINNQWRKTHIFRYKGFAVKKFRMLFREQRFLAKRKEKNREKNHVQRLLRHIPHVDRELVAKTHPNVKVEEIWDTKAARSTVIPKEFKDS